MSTRIVIVSNRLPVSLNQDSAGKWDIKPSSGGLVTALSPVVKEKRGIWIGWPGTPENIDVDDLLAKRSKELGYVLKPVPLTTEEYQKYYLGCSNEIIWPLFHDLQSRCNFEPGYWNAYEAVNRKFARVIAENTTASDYVWIQDYHLLLAARELRMLTPDRRIGFFLHTPFPPLDIYIKLPWRQQILRGMLEFDLLGFQAVRDRNNFLHCVASLNKGLKFDARRQISRIKMQERSVKVGVFPISIDFDEFSREALSPATMENAEKLHSTMSHSQLILGVDRLDYSKGISQKLKAFRTALETYDTLLGKISLVQIIVPSRENIPEYQAMRTEIEQLVSEINGKFGHPGWTPIHYMFRNLGRSELVSYYRAAEIALVTPLKDGMNLVAKEYCAAHPDGNGVLILSEFAGAASQLGRYALVVNPYDAVGTAKAIQQAYTISVEERKNRMTRLRVAIQRRDIYWWLQRFLKAAALELDIRVTSRNRYTVRTH
jgi:alpha,alpha-trehalose-phosphate synthase [UDP-forming]